MRADEDAPTVSSLRGLGELSIMQRAGWTKDPIESNPFGSRVREKITRIDERFYCFCSVCPPYGSCTTGDEKLVEQTRVHVIM